MEHEQISFSPEQELLNEGYTIEQNVVDWRMNRLNTWNAEEVEMPRTRTTPARTRGAPLGSRPDVAAVAAPPTFKADLIPGYGARNMEAVGDIHPVLNEYAVTLCRNIYFCNPHGEPKTPYVGPDLHIYFWSRPSQEYLGRIVTDQVYGYDLRPGQHDTVIPSAEDRELGEVLYDPTDNPAALVVESTLYVLFDLPHEEGLHTGMIMRHIMESYLKLIDPEEAEMRKRASITKAQERVPEVLKHLIAAPLQGELEKARRNIDAFERNAREYQAFLQEIIIKLASEQKALRRLEAESNGESTATKELNALKRIKKVTRISTRMDKLVVELDTVYLTTATARYEIGKFQIEFGVDHHFRIRNITGRILSYDHPHVIDGEPCLGNMKNILLYAYGGEIAMAVMTTIEYLNSYNPQSAYHPVDNWKEVENFVRPKAETPVVETHPARAAVQEGRTLLDNLERGVVTGPVIIGMDAGLVTPLATLAEQARELEREPELDEEFWAESEEEQERNV